MGRVSYLNSVPKSDLTIFTWWNKADFCCVDFILMRLIIWDIKCFQYLILESQVLPLNLSCQIPHGFCLFYVCMWLCLCIWHIHGTITCRYLSAGVLQDHVSKALTRNWTFHSNGFKDFFKSDKVNQISSELIFAKMDKDLVRL